MTTLYNGHHLRGPVTLTPIAECLAEELPQPVFTTYVCPDRGIEPRLSACEANALPLIHRDGFSARCAVQVKNKCKL